MPYNDNIPVIKRNRQVEEVKEELRKLAISLEYYMYQLRDMHCDDAVNSLANAIETVYQ